MTPVTVSSSRRRSVRRGSRVCPSTLKPNTRETEREKEGMRVSVTSSVNVYQDLLLNSCTLAGLQMCVCVCVCVCVSLFCFFLAVSATDVIHSTPLH